MILKLDRAIFGLMYRIGFTPWDGHQLPAHLRELVEGQAAIPAGRALDVGCGTGDTTIYLARHGWDATGIDFVERALEKARIKGERERANIRWLKADVTALGQYEIGGGFNLVVDNGLLHGLSDEDCVRSRAQSARRGRRTASDPGLWRRETAGAPRDRS